MAGPLSGIAGAQQQIPLATSSQPSQNTGAIRQQREEREPEANQVTPQGVQAAQSQETATEDQNILQQRLAQSLGTSADESASNTNQPRGSIVDIAV